MKRLSVIGILFAGALSVMGCAQVPGEGWTTLIDGGKGLGNFKRIGDANWRAEGGAVVADRGIAGYLVSTDVYRDFELYAEFFAEADTNSGIHIRMSDPKDPTPDNSYESNIWDTRPDPRFGTGAIVNYAAVPVPPVYRAAGRWNVYEIHAKGAEVTVTLNGTTTASIRDAKDAAGPFALQYAPGANGPPGGPIKWRKVMVKPL